MYLVTYVLPCVSVHTALGILHVCIYAYSMYLYILPVYLHISTYMPVNLCILRVLSV